MKTKSKILMIIIWLVISNIKLVGASPEVAVLYSQYSVAAYKSIGQDYNRSMQWVKEALDRIKVKYRFIKDSDIENNKIKVYKLLILPSSRAMSKKEIDIIGKFLKSGGRLLSFYTASYRNEKNEYWQDRDFGLKQIIDISKSQWVSGVPKCSYIKWIGAKDSPVWKGFKGPFVRVFRYTAFLVKVKDKSTVKAVWYDDKSSPSYSGEQNAAILEGKNYIHITEDLFAPENMHNPKVLKLLKNIINYLVKK